MSEYVTETMNGIVHITKTKCDVCGNTIKTTYEYPNGKTVSLPFKCNCNNQRTLEELEKAERIARAEKKRDLTEWGFHDKARRVDTFDKDRFKDEQNDEVKTMKFYATHFLDEFYPKNLGMLLVGSQGTGKTFRTSNIANYIVDQYLRYVLYYPLSELVYRWRDFDYREDIRHKIQVADLMIIDDFMLNSDWQIQTVYEIIECRYSANKPMIISANIEPKVFKEETDVEKARIYSRIMERCSYVFSFEKDEDMRVVISRENYTEMQIIFNKLEVANG